MFSAISLWESWIMSLSIVQLYEVHFTFRVVRPQWTFSRRTVLHVTSPRDCVSSQCLSSENRVPFNTSTYHELPAVELRMFKQWAGCIFQKNTSYINAWMRHCKWPMLGSGSWGRPAIAALLDASAKLEAEHRLYKIVININCIKRSS